MAVTVYKSTDASAPVLTGQAGTLLTVLDAVLVNGYGAKAAAGWSKPFVNSANKGCYKMGGGSLLSLAVDDSASFATSGAREAQVRGFETLSAVAAGTGPFPTVTQIGNAGLVVRKSKLADATAAPWIIVADSLTFYLFINTPDFTGYGGYMFGEFYSLKSGDAYRALIVGRVNTAGNVLIPLDSDDNLQTLFAPAIAAAPSTGHYVPRNPQGDIQSAVQVGKHADGVKGANQLLATVARLGNGLVTYPNATDASALLANVWIHDDLGQQMNIRGRMRGFWQFLHPIGSPVNDQDTFSGSGPLAGKTFLVIRPVADGDGLYVLETSNTWETSS